MTHKINQNKKMFNIALYQPDIPQNTAAIIRLCSCFNTTLEIIEPCGFHLNDKRLKRVAMDYLDKSKIITYKSYENFLMNKKNSRIILMTTKAKKNYHNFIFEPYSSSNCSILLQIIFCNLTNHSFVNFCFFFILIFL